MSRNYIDSDSMGMGAVLAILLTIFNSILGCFIVQQTLFSTPLAVLIITLAWVGLGPLAYVLALALSRS